MQPYNSDLFLTTSEVAELFGVHPSTVKRWTDGEGLEAGKTEGGHRRIYLRAALDFAASRGIETYLESFAPFESHVWLSVRDAVVDADFRRLRSLAMGWLVRGYPQRVTALFQELLDRDDLPLHILCDRGIRPFMEEVGTAWREGRLRIGEEHIASQAVMEALIKVSRPREGGESTQETGGAGTEQQRVAVVGATEGDHHHIGSMCVRILLERFGWHVLYPGANTPAEDFAALQRTQKADLICISVSPPASAAHILRASAILQQFYQPEHPYDLVFGGSELPAEPGLPDDIPFRSVQLFRTTGEFTEWIRLWADQNTNAKRERVQ